MAACDHVSMSSDISDDLCVHHSTIDTSVLRQDGATAPMPKRLKLEEDEAALASKVSVHLTVFVVVVVIVVAF